MPNGIDWQKIEQIRPSEKQSDIICAGRLVRHKNVDLLIQALEIVKSDIPDVKALIIGDGPESSDLKSRVRESGLEDNVEFCGFLEDYSDALALMRPSRPQLLTGETQRMDTGCGKLFVIMNDDEYGPREVFANMGKAGGCASSNTEALGRLISLALKKGASAQEIVEQLKGIRCHVPYGMGPNATLSCADAIGKALERRYVAGAAARASATPEPQLSPGRGGAGRLP